MVTRTQIIDAMQFDFVAALDAVNTTGAPRFQLSYQFAGNSQPADMTYSYTGWTTLSSTEMAAVRAALAHIETFLNVSFTELPYAADPDLNIGKVSLPSGVAGQGGPSVVYSGTKVIEWDGFSVYNRDLDLSSGAQNLILHELGHALGLDHPFEGVVLPTEYDNNHYTLMSYTDDPYSGTSNNAMMLYDILALQDIWGAAAYATGNDTYTGRGAFDLRVVWDTGGIDNFSAATRKHGVILDLRQGHFSTFGTYEDVAIAYDVRIENATGSAYDDTVRGNAFVNKLFGLAGADRMAGYAGADILRGGNGADQIWGGYGQDKLYGSWGRDTLYGGGHGDQLFGGGHADALFGKSGNDLLDGGTGNDALTGGLGVDTFVFRAGDGDDRVLDFADDVDRLRILDHGTRAEVLAAAHDVGSDVHFDFANGDSIVVLGITRAAIADDLLVS